MTRIIFLYLSALGVFLLIDGLWIGFVGSRFYAQYLGHLMSGKIAITPAILFYLIYIAGIVYFVIFPALQGNISLSQVALRGALLGFFAYSTYDLTNHVFMKQWSWFITITDILWGAFVTGLTAVIITKFFR